MTNNESKYYSKVKKCKQNNKSIFTDYHQTSCYSVFIIFMSLFFILHRNSLSFYYLSLFVHLSIRPSIHPLFHLSIHPSVRLSVCLSVCPSVRASLPSSVRPSVRPFVRPSVR